MGRLVKRPSRLEFAEKWDLLACEIRGRTRGEKKTFSATWRTLRLQ